MFVYLMISLACFPTPKDRLTVWLVGRSFYPCLLLLVTRFWSLRNQLRCPKSTKRFYFLSSKRFKGSLGWSRRGFPRCLRSFNCSMTSLFGHFNPLLNLQKRNRWILPLALVVIVLVFHLSGSMLSGPLKWSYFACISNRPLFLLYIIRYILLTKSGLEK